MRSISAACHALLAGLGLAACTASPSGVGIEATSNMQLLEVAAKGTLYGDKRILGALCIHQPLDLDPAAPGLQPSCVVSLVRDRHTANELETVVPACDPLRETRPCWQLEPLAACETHGPGSELRFEVDAGATWPEGLYVRASCEVE